MPRGGAGAGGGTAGPQGLHEVLKFISWGLEAGGAVYSPDGRRLWGSRSAQGIELGRRQVSFIEGVLSTVLSTLWLSICLNPILEMRK